MVAINCGFPMVQDSPESVAWMRSYKQNKFSEPVLFCENKRPSAHSATKHVPCLISKGASIWISSYQFYFWSHFCCISWPPMLSPSVPGCRTCSYMCIKYVNQIWKDSIHCPLFCTFICIYLYLKKRQKRIVHGILSCIAFYKCYQYSYTQSACSTTLHPVI